MKTSEFTREQISALADSQLDNAQVDSALASLRAQEAQADWELYHKIGDLLRSEDMGEGLSRNFSARLAARLEAEPTYIAPSAVKSGRSSARFIRHMAAAAAVATFAFVATPPLMEAMQAPASGESSLAVVSASVPPETAAQARLELAAASDIAEGDILRDPRIDDYLIAHQRFSPPVPVNAQYTRNANFSGK